MTKIKAWNRKRKPKHWIIKRWKTFELSVSDNSKSKLLIHNQVAFLKPLKLNESKNHHFNIRVLHGYIKVVDKEK